MTDGTAAANSGQQAVTLVIDQLGQIQYSYYNTTEMAGARATGLESLVDQTRRTERRPAQHSHKVWW